MSVYGPIGPDADRHDPHAHGLYGAERISHTDLLRGCPACAAAAEAQPERPPAPALASDLASRALDELDDYAARLGKAARLFHSAGQEAKAVECELAAGIVRSCALMVVRHSVELGVLDDVPTLAHPVFGGGW